MNENQTNNRRTVATRGGAVLVAVSAAICGFLHQWEDGGKTQITVYADKLAGGLPTACNGLTNAVSPYPVVVGEVWSQEKCDTAEAMVIETTQLALGKCITGRITQSAFDALTSHAHNFGVGKTCGSTAVGLINAGHLVEGCHAISQTPDGKPNWSSAEGKFYQGLYNRRLAETALCLKDA